MTRILGIETTCDDTCSAVVRDGLHVESNIISSQEELHRRFKGVVPEIASRAHLERILPVVSESLDVAGIGLSDIDAVAVSNRPGLIGGLLVGLSTAKAIAAWLGIPLIAVNHIQSHLYAGIMASPHWQPPAIALTASGGHTMLCLVQSPLSFSVLGATIDDAGGEAFDKGANLLGYDGQGGIAIDRAAKQGDPRAIKFPRPMIDSGDLNFSFAGLKTALLYEIYGASNRKKDAGDPPPLTDERRADLAASYQEAICDVLVAKTMLAAVQHCASTIFVTGGVSANSRLRDRIGEAARKNGMSVIFPSMKLCTDNAAMIAGLACHHLMAGEISSLELEAYPRWSEQDNKND